MTETRRPADSINQLGIEIMTEMFGAERAASRNRPDDLANLRMNSVLTEFAYARVWANDTLTRRERSLITVALLAATGKETELALHLRAALKNGCTLEELHEVMVHLVLYCGFPSGLTGQRHINQIEQEISKLGGK